jgi:hypothetical protein
MAKATLVLLIPALAGCGVNFNAQTNEVYTPAQGVNDRDGQVDVLGAAVVSALAGSGTVVATLVNEDLEDVDRLTAVTVEGAQAEIAPGETEIPANGSLDLATSGAVQATSDGIEAGRFVEVVFSFERAEAVTIEVPVVTHEEDYLDVPVEGSEE